MLLKQCGGRLCGGRLNGGIVVSYYDGRLCDGRCEVAGRLVPDVWWQIVRLQVCGGRPCGGACVMVGCVLTTV